MKKISLIAALLASVVLISFSFSNPRTKATQSARTEKHSPELVGSGFVVERVSR